jgi:hypothetical protein
MQKELEMKLIVMILCAAAAAFAQKTESHMPVTDAEKVADALRAAPEFITKDATLLDWPTTRGGEYRVLRKGSSQWTCLPGLPGSPHDEPGCFDQVFYLSRTVSPVVHPRYRASAFHICMVDSGSPTNRMSRGAATSSTLGHTS